MKKLLLSAISALLIFGGTAMADDAMHFYNLGIDSSMNYRKIYYFTKALELNPKLSSAYEKRGTIYYFQEKYKRMIDDFLRFTKLKPFDADGYRMLGFAYMKKGDYNKAVANLTRALDLTPRSAELYGYRAETYHLMGMAEKAVQDATRAIEIGVKRQIIGRAYSTRAKAYKELGQTDLADADLKKAVNLDPAYDIYKFFTVTEFLADSASNSGSLKGVGRMGAALIIAILFVFIFKLSIPAPKKDK